MPNSRNKIIVTSFALVFLMLAALAGCKNDSVTDPLSTQTDGVNGNVVVGIYAENNGNDNNTIIITHAKLIMRQLRLQTNGNEITQGIRLDPFVVYINLHPRVMPIGIANVQPGNYHLLKLQIHKPNPHETVSDPEFLEPNGTRYSFIIQGLFNGNPFTYKSQVTAARGINIEGNPVYVVEGTTLYITLRVNPYSWFDRNGDVMNPLDEGNRHDIDNNIKESFKRAFKDMDRNGEPD